jgi:hypothetical protein
MQMISLPGLAMANLAKERAKEKDFKKVKKRLKKKYTFKKVRKLQKKYLNDHDELLEQLGHLEDQFLEDHGLFRDLYSGIMEDLLEALKAVQQTGYQKILDVDNFLVKVTEKIEANPEKFTTDPALLKKFEKKFKAARKELSVDGATDMVAISRLSKGKRYIGSIKSRILNRNSVEREGIRFAEKVRTDVEELKAIKTKINQELKSGSGHGLLALLLEYITSLRNFNKQIQVLKSDVEIIIQEVANDVAEVVIKYIPFITIMEGNKDFMKDVAAARNEFLKLQNKVIANLLDDLKWPRIEEATVENLSETEEGLFIRLERLKVKGYSHRVEDSLDRELGQ